MEKEHIWWDYIIMNQLNINILVEGKTEIFFVKEVIQPYLANDKIYVYPISVETSPNHRGGVTRYAKIKNDISRLLKRNDFYLTTIFDVYGLPTDFPNFRDAFNLRCYDKVKKLEEGFGQDVSHEKFIPYLQLYEFEALLFSDIDILFEKLKKENTKDQIREKLHKIVSSFDTPEHINDHPDTAPSKRLMHLYNDYEKINQGIQVAKSIGLSKMRKKCKHFDEWLNRLEDLRD